MSKRNWKILFQDILDSIEKIERYTKEMQYDDFVINSMVVDAVVRNIEIIGEASKKIPANVRKKHEQIPWKKMAGIRNRIVHDYFGVDVSIIWFIVEKELSQLKEELRIILTQSTQGDSNEV